MMSEKWEKVITKTLGVNPICINSALVSAQNRKRLYWTNIGLEIDKNDLFGAMKSIIPQPKDRGILLKDVLESGVDKKYNLSDKMISWLDKHAKKRGVEVKKKTGLEKACTLTASAQLKQNLSTDYIKIEGCDYRRDEGLRIKKNQKTGTLTARAREDESCGQLVKIERKIITHSLQPRNGKGKGGKGHLCKTDNKSYCVDTGNGQAIERSSVIRRLTPIECERLQGFPDNYTKGVSDSQRYKMLGNGWQVDTIKHMFKYLK